MNGPDASAMEWCEVCGMPRPLEDLIAYRSAAAPWDRRSTHFVCAATVGMYEGRCFRLGVGVASVHTIAAAVDVVAWLA